MHLDFDMGRYGLFVWGSWGITALGLAVIVVRAELRRRNWSLRAKALTPPESDPS